MDSITHTLAGAVIAKAIDDQKVGKWGTIAGLSMGFFPDSDFVLGLFNHQFYLQYHRHFTHSLLLIPLYALFFSWLFIKITRRPYFWSFYKICLSVLVSHVIFDLLTSYGTMIFSPFMDHRFSWDLIFIIDFIFSGIIYISLFVSLFWKRMAPWICRGSLLGLTLYILFCWVQHNHAMEEAKLFAKNLDEEVIQVASLPQPISPFRWANYVETRDRGYQGFIDLLRKEPHVAIGRQNEPLTEFSSKLRRLNSLYQPPKKANYQSWDKSNHSPWVEKALKTKGVKFYYWFARFPVVKLVNLKDGRHLVEFMDVRFFLPGIRMPFVYYVEFDDLAKIQSEGFMRE